jgi:hypothetical protein
VKLQALSHKKIFNSNGVSFTEARSNFILKNSNGFLMGENHQSSVFHVMLLQKKKKVWKEIMNIHQKDFFMI